MSDKEKGPSQASQLVALARAGYDLVMSEDGRPYGVRRRGPNIALPLRGKAGLRAQLARQFTDANGGQVPSSSALTDAMAVLEGMAMATDPVQVHLRVAGGPDQIVLDLGTADGRCVIVTADGWSVHSRSPVLFRRSGAMSPMPEPAHSDGDGLAMLHGLVNMDNPTFHQLVAWLVAAWVPHIPHPVLTFKGEQGTGKSKTAQMVINLVDPSAATKRSQPRDVKTWATQAFNSWALCLDNVSTIAPWLSDTLCKAVTGDGIIDRALYTDDDVVVLSFRRVLAMTTIDAGALAGDLAERIFMLDLQLISEDQRRTEQELDRRFETDRPAILAALLDLLAKVLDRLPSIHLDRMPRMADFACVLAAIDAIQGWSTLETYITSADNVAADALEGDPFGSAVVAFIQQQSQWTGTAGQLLEQVPPPDGYHPKWPKDATRAGGQLKRLAPILRSVGITFDDTARSSDRHRHRLISLRAQPENGCKTASAASAASSTAPDLRDPAGTEANTSVHAAPQQRPQDRKVDARDATPDAENQLATARSKIPEVAKQPPSDATGAADTASQPISDDHLLCPQCGLPMDSTLTAAGTLVHPDCLAP
ncbi:ATP-binding protein [Streptosporangium sp. NPDC050855]|uniref:ATP-binding protein n=1 Tax=Streptosporangium sp. NPDC050855 TaxID=3366194 RepID=UPI00379F5AD7